MSAPRNGLASSSAELHQRHGAGYDSHTPEHRASSETVRQGEVAAREGPSNSNDNGSEPFLLGTAIKVQPAASAGRRRSRSSDSQGGSPSASSTSSDEDESLLPSFGGADDADPILAKHKNASPLLFQKSSPKHEGYGDGTPSASTTSLGLNAHAQNGFTSRDDDLAQDRRRMHDDGSEGQLGAEKRRKKGKGKAVKGKGKRPSWKERERQRTRAFAREMAFVTVPSILLSMVGSVLAGEVLANLKTWPVFLRVEELFILVPILLNLKGNLEMNLAARFSTSANIGELDLRQTRRSLVLGNMALLQVQALLVSLIAGIVAFVLGLLSRHGVTDSLATLAGQDVAAYGVERGGYFEFLMVLCASMIAASLSSAVVGAFMCSLVVVSRFLRINPDNLATPLAASIGDLLALVILAIVANEGAIIIGTLWSTFIFIGLLFFIGINVYFTLRNAYVQELIWGGWVPLLLALAVSSGTGLVLQTYVNEFRGFGLLVPVVTGVAGNVGAIFVSRISTALHGAKEERYLLTAGTLFGISSPILIAFLGFVWLTGQMRIGFAFGLSYILLSFGIMTVSLATAYYLTFWLWSRDYDPDINALPLLSSAVDLFGQLMLVGAFLLAKSLGGDVLLPTPVVTPSGDVLVNATAIAEAVASASASAGASSGAAEAVVSLFR